MKLSVVTSRILRTQEFQKLRKGKYMKDKIQTVMKTALILFRQPCTVTLWNGVIFKYVFFLNKKYDMLFLNMWFGDAQTAIRFFSHSQQARSRQKLERLLV